MLLDERPDSCNFTFIQLPFFCNIGIPVNFNFNGDRILKLSNESPHLKSNSQSCQNFTIRKPKTETKITSASSYVLLHE